MFITNILFLALLVHIFDSTQSRVIKFEEIPLSPGELTVKFVANKDTSSNNIGKLVIVLRNKENSENKTKMKLPEIDPSYVPDLLDKVGIVAEKCPVDYKRVGFTCIPNKKS
ncbi:unnamed protein product, partial [Brenthis ino]